MAFEVVRVNEREGLWFGELEDLTTPADAGLRVLVSHFPMISLASHFAARGWKYPRDLANLGGASMSVSGSLGPTLVLSGHLHRADAHHEANVLQLSAPPMVEPPFCATLIEVTLRPPLVEVRRWVIPTDERSVPDPEHGIWEACRGWDVRTPAGPGSQSDARGGDSASG